MREAHRALDAARGCHYEDHQAALDEAVRAHEIADTLDDGPLRCRALVLQAAVMLQRGDLHGAATLTTEATRSPRATPCPPSSWPSSRS